MLNDIRITVRQLRKAPGHIAAVILALATGLAVCVAVFSVMQAVLFGEAPGMFRRVDLVHVRWGDNNAPLSNVEWDRAQQLLEGPFTSVSAEGIRRMAVGLPTGPVTLTASIVSSRYFETLGTVPVLGRLLDSADAIDGGPLVVMLGARVWREHFGGSREAIGATITVAGLAAVVVGVTPDRMAGLALRDSTSDDDLPQLWLPLKRTSAQLSGVPSQRWLSVAGRLRPGAALSSARADTARVGRLLEGERLTASPAKNQALRAFRAGFDWRDTPVDALTVTALVLFVPIGVLAIGCVNVVNLQLSRAADRVRELRLRLTLGASRARMVRLLATEVVLLFALAATVGWRGAITLLRFAEPYVGRPLAIAAPVLWFGLALTLLVIAVAGVAPAWLATRGLSRGHGLERGHEALRFKKLRAALVVAQVTASMALLFVSALGIASLEARAPTLPRGADQVLIAEFALGDVHYSRTQAGVFVRGVMESLGGETTAAAGFSDFLPFTGAVRYALPGDAPDVPRIARGGYVTSGWFAANDLRFVAGQSFGFGASAPAAVVSEAAAAAIAGNGGAAVGRVVRAAHEDGALREVEIVGVVADHVTLGGQPVPMMFLPMPAAPPTSLFLSARGPQVSVVAGQIRRAVDAVDRSVPWVRMDTLTARQQSVSRSYRQVVWLGTVLGTLSVGLAASGLFALMSYTVQRRTHEFGVRLAIGAAPRDVAQMVLRQGLTLVGLGVFGGFLIAIPLGYVLRSVLVGTSPVDPFTMSTVTVVFLIVGAVAAAAPALRAARVDPMVAVRQE
jgi:putative ABC transport system permease protein